MGKITWHKLRKYVRYFDIGNIFTRDGIIYHYSTEYHRRKSKKNRILRENWVIKLEPSRKALDKNLNILIQSGCIEEISFNTFKVLRKLTKDAKASDLKIFASDDWKGWFLGNKIFEDY